MRASYKYIQHLNLWNDGPGKIPKQWIPSTCVLLVLPLPAQDSCTMASRTLKVHQACRLCAALILAVDQTTIAHPPNPLALA